MFVCTAFSFPGIVSVFCECGNCFHALKVKSPHYTAFTFKSYHAALKNYACYTFDTGVTVCMAKISEETGTLNSWGIAVLKHLQGWDFNDIRWQCVPAVQKILMQTCSTHELCQFQLVYIICVLLFSVFNSNSTC